MRAYLNLWLLTITVLTKHAQCADYALESGHSRMPRPLDPTGVAVPNKYRQAQVQAGPSKQKGAEGPRDKPSKPRRQTSMPPTGRSQGAGGPPKRQNSAPISHKETITAKEQVRFKPVNDSGRKVATIMLNRQKDKAESLMQKAHESHASGQRDTQQMHANLGKYYDTWRQKGQDAADKSRTSNSGVLTSYRNNLDSREKFAAKAIKARVMARKMEIAGMQT